MAKNKNKTNEKTEDEIQEEVFQKAFFIYTFENNPNMTYGNKVLKFINSLACYGLGFFSKI